MTTKMKSWLNIGLLLVTLLVNFLGASGLINGMSQADVSAKYPTLITPAGFTFSIWGVIYSLLLIATLWMAKNVTQRQTKQLIENISPHIWLTLTSNMIWIILFSFELIGLSTIFILIYLLGLIAILMKLKSWNGDGKWFYSLAFGLNTGWLLIASLVNIAAYLVKIDWSGFGIGENIWAGIAIVIAIVMTWLISNFTKNAVLGLPVAWAFFGIWQALNQNGNYVTLVISSIVGIFILFCIVIRQFIKNGYNIVPKVSSEIK